MIVLLEAAARSHKFGMNHINISCHALLFSKHFTTVTQSAEALDPSIRGSFYAKKSVVDFPTESWLTDWIDHYFGV